MMEAGAIKQYASAFIMLAAAALLMWMGEFFDNPPRIAQNRLLVAMPDARDARFDKTVILVLMHEKAESFGLVLNKPAPGGEYYFGGPMERDKKIYALHSPDVKMKETIVIKGLNLGIVEGQAAVDKLKSEKVRPKWHIVVKGYSGWGKRQLNSELDRGDWKVVAFSEKLVEQTKPEQMWEKALAQPAVTESK